MSSVVVEASGVSKSYPSGGRTLVVLENLDFRADEGEMVAIVGASGVGKSTLLHLLGGIDRPDGGEVTFRGRTLSQLDDAELAGFRNRDVGFVFQFHYLLPEFSALENVMMPLLIRRMSQAEAVPLAMSLLEELGIAERSHHRPSELSGGEQQRVAIARALVSGPGMVLADEPTGNLDQRTGEQVFDVFAARTAARGLTTVLVTHNESLAKRADRTLRLIDRRLTLSS